MKRLSVSGSKGTDAIYRVLALLMTNELATLISYAGTRGGKQSFRDHERITGCVYCNNYYAFIYELFVNNFMVYFES